MDTPDLEGFFKVRGCYCLFPTGMALPGMLISTIVIPGIFGTRL